MSFRLKNIGILDQGYSQEGSGKIFNQNISCMPQKQAFALSCRYKRDHLYILKQNNSYY